MFSGRAILLTTRNLKEVTVLSLDCVRIVVFITNFREVPVYAFRMHVDDVFVFSVFPIQFKISLFILHIK